ncbi:MAG: hypothetical protein EHV01_002940 [Spiroplasma sp. hy2]|uniref:hypothetical protein n=1 Tax=Spiroplasma sp. hy2 TaxID=2490850 RepID=UPI003848456C
MARQWSKEEKIKAIKYSNKYGINKTIKKFNINYTTIIRWRSEFKKHGEYGLEWGNGKQATIHKYKPRREKNVDINLMSR